MLNLDFAFFAVAVPVVIFAGISKAGFGSGGAFVSSAILAILLDPGVALALMLPLLMVIDVATLRPYWRDWNLRAAGVLIAGAVPGVILGALVFRQADPDLIRLLIGVISLMFVSWQLARAMGWIQPAKEVLASWVGMVAGLAAGFTSFVSHAGGPPAAVYLLSRKLSKTEFQATTVLTFNAINAMKVAPYVMLGLFSKDTVVANLALAPVVLLGAWIGVWAHKMVSERLFFSLTHVLLTITGIKLIWDALT